jgi:hypothetical protein
MFKNGVVDNKRIEKHLIILSVPKRDNDLTKTYKTKILTEKFNKNILLTENPMVEFRALTINGKII